MRLILTLVFLTLSLSPNALAWGRRGHAMIAAHAAYLIGEGEVARMLQSRAFDLAYYANVPDMLWKKPDYYKAEWFNHFMDMEIFQREIKDMSLSDAFRMSRQDFAEKFPKFPENAGRSFWRIQEFVQRLDAVAKSVAVKDLPLEKRHELQAEWLVVAGTLAHYLGDLSQPLHCTENYDGEKSGQKGIHSFFEDLLVDELYPSIEVAVFQEAKKRWPKYHREQGKKSVLELIESLASGSQKEVEALLSIDRRTGRKEVRKAAQAFRAMLVDRLVMGTLITAEVWSRHIAFDANNERFFNFVANPDYVRY